MTWRQRDPAYEKTMYVLMDGFVILYRYLMVVLLYERSDRYIIYATMVYKGHFKYVFCCITYVQKDKKTWKSFMKVQIYESTLECTNFKVCLFFRFQQRVKRGYTGRNPVPGTPVFSWS